VQAHTSQLKGRVNDVIPISVPDLEFQPRPVLGGPHRSTVGSFVLFGPDLCDGIHLEALGCQSETVFLKDLLKLVDPEQNVIMAWVANCQGGDGCCTACDDASAATLRKVCPMAGLMLPVLLLVPVCSICSMRYSWCSCASVVLLVLCVLLLAVLCSLCYSWCFLCYSSCSRASCAAPMLLLVLLCSLFRSWCSCATLGAPVLPVLLLVLLCSMCYSWCSCASVLLLVLCVPLLLPLCSLCYSWGSLCYFWCSCALRAALGAPALLLVLLCSMCYSWCSCASVLLLVLCVLLLVPLCSMCYSWGSLCSSWCSCHLLLLVLLRYSWCSYAPCATPEKCPTSPAGTPKACKTF
jgi:hypothetical protein